MNLSLLDGAVVVLVLVTVIVITALVVGAVEKVRTARWEAEKARHEANWVRAATTPAVER